LERYCKEHGYTAFRHYDEDDGYSGTNFNRPGFQRMLADIKEGKIKRVVVKDYCAIIGLNQKDLENQGILA
jgi:site-specific DNA recombinase